MRETARKKDMATNERAASVELKTNKMMTDCTRLDVRPSGRAEFIQQ